MYHFGIIPGDTAGRIRTRCALKVIEQAAILNRFTYQLDTFDLGADNYIETGELISDSQIASLGAMDGIFLGGFGDPRLERSVCENGIKKRLWADLNLFVTVRGICAYSEALCPLKGERSRSIDFAIVRENTETSYSDLGSFIHKNTPDELALMQGVFIRKTVERVIRSAFEIAHHRPRHMITLVDRYPRVPAHDLGRRILADVGREFPDVKTECLVAEEIAGAMFTHPEQFDVIMTTADIGDMLMEMGVELQGGAGYGATVYMNPGQIAMYEPCQGWGNDWENRRSPNPIGAIVAVAQMLFDVGQPEAAEQIKRAVSRVVREHSDMLKNETIDYASLTKLVVLAMGA